MVKGKHLVFISEQIYPYRIGGTEVFNYYLVKALVPSIDVTCINSYSSETVDGVNHVKIGLPIMQRLLFPPLAALSILKIGMRARPHVVLSFSRSRWFYWILYPMLKLLFGMHYTIIIHGGGLKVWKFRAPFLWLFKHADNVVGVSDRISVEYGNRTGQNVITIPPLIPFVISELDKKEARSMFDLPTTATIILMVGSLTDIKCTDTTIQALAHLGNESLNKHNIFLVLAGDGAKRPEFEEEARKLHVSERVRFLGNVPREDVKYLYRAADFYVMASKFEGTPISMLEAMANGLPIIGSDAPGINALVKHGESALLFPIKDSKRLSELISSVLDDEGLRNELSQNSLVTVRSNFSYDKMVNKYKEIFRL